MKTSQLITFAALTCATSVSAQRIKTEDTRIGKLEFQMGLPTEKSVGKLFDEMDFQRACQAYGVGQAYIGVHRDKNGNPFDGAKRYRLHVPPNPPAGQFWSVTIYDLETRRPVENSTQMVDRSSRQPDLVKNADGSVDLYFGTKAAKGQEANTLITVSGRAWFPLFRLYGPQQPYFDRSWPLPDVEIVK